MAISLKAVELDCVSAALAGSIPPLLNSNIRIEKPGGRSPPHPFKCGDAAKSMALGQAGGIVGLGAGDGSSR